MQYRVKLYNNTGDTAIKTFSDAVIVGWSKRINAPGRAAFWLPARSTTFTISNLQKYQRVRIERRRRDGSGDWDTVWYGYIEAHKRMDENRIGVTCQGMLNFFKKRYCATNEAFTGAGSTEAFGLLTDANSTETTGITAGTGGVVSTKAVTMQGRVDMLRAWEQLAQAHNCEFEITEDGLFNFVPLLGTDKSTGAGTITLKFRRDGRPGNNMRDTLEGEDGETVVNRLHAASTAGGAYTYNDAASQAIYGILEGFKQFNEAQDNGTLISMATALGTQLGNPITDFQALPILAQKQFNTARGFISGNLCVNGTPSAEGQNLPDEGVDKAFDGDYNTKWLIFSNSSPWIQYQFGYGARRIVNRYAITSGNDSPTRDPKNWKFQGGDGISWTDLDTRTNETFATRNLRKEYTFTNTSPYEFYRLDITSNNGSSITQLSELEMYMGTATEDADVISGIQYGDIVLGDLIKVEIITETETIQQARRVAEIDVEVDENEDETVKYTLSKAGVFLTSAYLNVDEAGAIKRRIREIEGVL